jgi:AcrR family transcriptional regulator
MAQRKSAVIREVTRLPVPEPEIPGADDGDPHPRPRGRPRTEIDPDAVADAVAWLFEKGGMDAVSIVSAAQKLDVSRATLYRAVPTKTDLLGILFERATREITELALAVKAADFSAEERLIRLVELQVDVAIRMRRYLPVFYGGGGLPPDVYERWHSWNREYEVLWMQCVADAMDAAVLARSNVVVTTRLILGMCVWVSRWYRPNEGIDAAVVAQSAIALLLPHTAAPKPSAKSAKSRSPATGR